MSKTVAIPDVVVIDGENYVRESKVTTAPRVEGSRRVVVVDRGWVYAGDVEREDMGDLGPVLRLTRAVWVFRWSSIGFDGVLRQPKSEKVDIRKLAHDVEIPVASVMFSVPVDDSWGL